MCVTIIGTQAAAIAARLVAAEGHILQGQLRAGFDHDGAAVDCRLVVFKGNTLDKHTFRSFNAHHATNVAGISCKGAAGDGHNGILVVYADYAAVRLAGIGVVRHTAAGDGQIALAVDGGAKLVCHGKAGELTARNGQGRALRNGEAPTGFVSFHLGQSTLGIFVEFGAHRIRQGHIRAAGQGKDGAVGFVGGQGMSVQIQREVHRRNRYRLGKIRHQMNGRLGGHRVVLQRGHRLGKRIKEDIILRGRLLRQSAVVIERGDIVGHFPFGDLNGQKGFCRRQRRGFRYIVITGFCPGQSPAQLVKVGLGVVPAAKVIVPAVVGIHAVFRRIPESKNLGIALKIHIVALAIAAGVAVNQRTVDGDFVAAVAAGVDTAGAVLTYVAGNDTAGQLQFSKVTIRPDTAASAACILVAGNLAAGHDKRGGALCFRTTDIHRAAGAGIAPDNAAGHGEAGTPRRSAVVHIHRAGTVRSVGRIGMIFNAAAVHDHLSSLHNAHRAIANPPAGLITPEIAGNGTVVQLKVGTVTGQIHRRELPMSADFVPGDFAAAHNDTAKCFNGTRICCDVSRINGSIPRNRAAVDGQRRVLLHIDAAAALALIAGDSAAVHGHGTAGAQDHTAAGSGGVVVFLNGNILHGEAAARVDHHRAGGRAGEVAAAHTLHGQAGRVRGSRSFRSFHRFRRGLPNGEDGAGVGKDGVPLKVQHGGHARRDGDILRIVPQKQNGGIRGCSGLDGIKGRLKGCVYSVPDLRHGICRAPEGIGLHAGFFRMAAGKSLRQSLAGYLILPGRTVDLPSHVHRRSDADGSFRIRIKGRLRNIQVVALLVGPVVPDHAAGDGKAAVIINDVRRGSVFQSAAHIHTAAVIHAAVAGDRTAADGGIRRVDTAHISGNHTAGNYRDAAVNAPTAVVRNLAAADGHSARFRIVPIQAAAIVINATGGIVVDFAAGHDNLRTLIAVIDTPLGVIVNIGTLLDINRAISISHAGAGVFINIAAADCHGAAMIANRNAAVFREGTAGDGQCSGPCRNSGYAGVA